VDRDPTHVPRHPGADAAGLGLDLPITVQTLDLRLYQIPKRESGQ
jgi:hypothetical protein